jgi:hypothetical protein
VFTAVNTRVQVASGAGRDDFQPPTSSKSRTLNRMSEVLAEIPCAQTSVIRRW